MSGQNCSAGSRFRARIMRNLSSCRPFNWSMGQRSSGLEWILKRPGMSELRMCALASANFKKNFARGIQISGSTDIQIQNSSIYASSTVLDGYGLFVEGNASNILQY